MYTVQMSATELSDWASAVVVTIGVTVVTVRTTVLWITGEFCCVTTVFVLIKHCVQLIMGYLPKMQ